MDKAELQAMQRPLKERYRDAPETALVTLVAQGRVDAQGLSCSVSTARALVEAGMHSATGGDGTLVCSGDMLLEALAACAGVTLRAVATSLGLSVSGSIRVEGDLDFRGTLGVAKEESVPVGFQAIRLSFELESDAAAEELDTLVRLTQRYCVVLQTLAAGVPVAVSLARPAP